MGILAFVRAGLQNISDSDKDFGWTRPYDSRLPISCKKYPTKYKEPHKMIKFDDFVAASNAVNRSE